MFVICSVLAATLLGGFSCLYPSSFLHEPTIQTPVAEIDGMGWFLNQKNPTLQITTLLLTPQNFQFASSNWNADAPVSDNYSFGATTALPLHLGYNNNSTLGKSVGNDTYVVLTEKAKEFYVDVLPELAPLRYSPRDFKHMDNDTSLDKLYSNGGLDIWYLHSLSA